MVKSRKWFLTINNYSDEEYDKGLKEIETTAYGLICKEVGEQGTPHIHIWLHYKNARDFNSIQKKFKRANIQEGKGRDIDQEYLKKDGVFVEFGTMETQGKRSDLIEIRECIKNGGGMNDIIEVSSNYQSMRMGELLLKYQETERPVEKIQVIWYHGIAEGGKTRKIYDTEVNIFRPTSYKWWEGYDKHKVVLIDDYRPTFCSFTALLKLTDIYPFRIQTKGGSRQVAYNKIYITSHLSPREYFEEMTDNEYEQLGRRITEEVHFTKKYKNDTEVRG